MSHTVIFKPSGRGKAQCPPDPDFPHGIAIDGCPDGGTFCEVALPYPAPECGYHYVLCGECSTAIAVTAAGRPDDPISVRVPCNVRPAPASARTMTFRR